MLKKDLRVWLLYEWCYLSMRCIRFVGERLPPFNRPLHPAGLDDAFFIAIRTKQQQNGPPLKCKHAWHRRCYACWPYTGPTTFSAAPDGLTRAWWACVNCSRTRENAVPYKTALSRLGRCIACWNSSWIFFSKTRIDKERKGERG